VVGNLLLGHTALILLVIGDRTVLSHGLPASAAIGLAAGGIAAGAGCAADAIPTTQLASATGTSFHIFFTIMFSTPP
jgi:hypothetical protein